MKDLRKMGIDGIDRHLHCYKLLVKFLKQEKKYRTFINILFVSQNRTVYDLIKTMNEKNIVNIYIEIPCEFPEIDKKWSALFNYVPFLGNYWDALNLGQSFMEKFHKRWKIFLIENKDR